MDARSNDAMEVDTPSTPSLEEEILEKLDFVIRENQTPMPAWLIRANSLFQASIAELEPHLSKNKVKTISALSNLLHGRYENYTRDTQLEFNCRNIVSLLTLTERAMLYKHILKNQAPRLDAKVIRYFILIRLQRFCHQVQTSVRHLTQDDKLQVINYQHMVFIPGKTYEHLELVNIFNRFTKHAYKTTFKHLLEHMLLIFAGIHAFPMSAYFTEKLIWEEENERRIQQIPGCSYFIVSLSQADAQAFEKFYTAFYSQGCESVSAYQPELKAYCFDTSLLVKIILSPAFKAAFENFMQTMLPVYQQNESSECISHEAVRAVFDEVTKIKKLNADSDIAENLLLFSFGLPVDVEYAQFNLAMRYEDFAKYTDFSLSISVAQAHTLIAAINAEFPNAAKLAGINQPFSSKHATLVQIVSIQNTTIVSAPFRSKLKMAFGSYINEKPDMMERCLKQLNLMQSTTLENSTALDALASTYAQEDGRLASALYQLSLFNRSRKAPAEIKSADFALQKAISGHIAQCPDRETYQLFKSGDKAKIKRLQEVVMQAAIKRAVNV